MFSIFKDRPEIVQEAQKAKFKPHFILQLLLFIGVFLVTQIVSGIPLTAVMVIEQTKAIAAGTLNPTDIKASIQFATDFSSQGFVVLIALFSTVIATILVVIYCRFIEKRSLHSMGFVKRHAIKDYFVGIIIGFVMFGSCVLIAFLTGSLAFNGFILSNGLGLLFLFLFGFILQGMSEEVILRGYLMISLATKKSILFAVLANSILFSLIHLLNNGITLFAIINLILFGVFASVYTLRMNSIWGICAIHSIWNFAQGNIFGIKVSGNDAQVSVFGFSSTKSGELINGGAFGLEGGLAVTIVLIVSILIVMVLKKKEVVSQDTPADFTNDEQLQQA